MAIPLALIGMIPSIINLFTGETSRTDSVIDLAKKAGEALGMENATPEDVLKHIEQNPDAVVKLKELEFNAKTLENEHLRKQVEEADRHEEVKRNMAHETYRIKSDKQDRIAEQIISFNLPVIAVLVLVNIGLVYYMKENASLIAIASNIIGVAIGNLFNERQSIINFFFGSSIGSKEKQDKIDTMLKG